VDFDLLWRDAVLEDENDPKTFGLSPAGDAPTTDLPRFDLDVAALLEIDASALDGLSEFQGGHTIGIGEQLTQPRAVLNLPAQANGAVAADSAKQSECDLHSPAPVREITTGTILRSRHVLGRVLGRGGNSTVFEAQDLHRSSGEETGAGRIALKLLLPELRTNPHALTRMKREFRQMQCLTHPGIARVFDLDCEGDDWFMTMELVAGQTVNAWMRENASGQDAMRVIGACCDALAHAHDLKILHGDLKPSNVLVAADHSIKIIDFGSASSPGALALHGSDLSLAATPSYASPQVLAGDAAEPRDDIFSLACLSYAILSRGAHPFARKSSLDAFQAQLRPAYVAGIPPRLFEVIVRGLSWEREQRPASVREFLHALISSDLSRSSALTRDSVVQHVMRVLTPGRHPKVALTMPSVVHQPPPASPCPPGEGTDQAQASPQIATAASLDGSSSAHDPSRNRESDDRVAHDKSSEQAANLPPPQRTPSQLATPSVVPSVGAIKPAAQSVREVGGLIADSLQDVPEKLLHIDADAAAQLALPTLHSDFSNSGSSSLTAEYRRSLIVLAMVLAGTVFFIRQSATEDPPETVASAPAAASTRPASTATTPQQLESRPLQIDTLADNTPAPPPEAPPPVTPDAPGMISFDSPSVVAGSAQTLVAITLNRLQSTLGSARVAWRIETGGTARPGIDYAPTQPQVIKFIEGQATRSIFIPLLNTGAASTARTPRTFTVSLKKMAGGPALGSITKVNVTIPPLNDSNHPHQIDGALNSLADGN
jgi:serine/threonine protein kinase